ncbi:MAG TPA: DUF4129 domain-containing protein [Anaerolineae bacterium]
MNHHSGLNSSEKIQAVTANHPLSFRRELRFVLLAAMETCWAYSALALAAAFMGLGPAIAPFSLFAAYWIALVVGRILPRRKERWVLLQLLALGIAAITMITVARIELYPRTDLFDFSWLPRYGMTLLSFTGGLVAEHLAAIGVLYAFVRGLGFGQRPMTLWFTAFQFRLGIVIFFLLLVFSAIEPFDPSPWLFTYFVVSLLAIALARIDEMESDVKLGPRWALTLLTSVMLVILLGWILLQFLTVDSATAFLRLFGPVGALVAAIVTLLALPFVYIASWIIDRLIPLFSGFGRFFQALAGLIPSGAGESLRQAQDRVTQLSFLEPILRALFVLAVVLTVGYLVAHALNRRMKRIESELYSRESLSESERNAERTGARKKRVSPRRQAGSLAAESIRRIYAALVARAGEAGLPRAVAETPYEYLPRLERAWPEHAADLHSITEAYVDVHYGEREFPPEQVDRLREAWKQVERVLKQSNAGTLKR